MFNKTMYYQKRYGFQYNKNDKTHASWNNEADAFKHAFMQAVGSLRYGDFRAKAGAWWHEYENRDSQPSGEENMDNWNNKIGIEITQELRELAKSYKLTEQQMEDIAAFKIVQRMKKGDLITHPSDKRQYKDFDKYMKKTSVTGYAADISQKVPINENEIYYALEDIGNMSTDEFLDAENVINKQLASGMMGSKAYFEAKVKLGDLVWVDEYIRGDGIKVKGHYRAKPQFL